MLIRIICAAVLAASTWSIVITTPSKAGPLHDAALDGDIKTMERLIAEGTDVGASDSAGSTPLHVSAMNGQARVCELLIRHGADINAKNKSGSTPFTLLR